MLEKYFYYHSEFGLILLYIGLGFIKLIKQAGTLFPETCAIEHAHADTHASKFPWAIYHTSKIKVFSFFALMLLNIFCKDKFFIEGFFMEDYIKEI